MNRFVFLLVCSLILTSVVNWTTQRASIANSLRIYDAQMNSRPVDTEIILRKVADGFLTSVNFPYRRLQSTVFFGYSRWYSWTLVVFAEAVVIALLCCCFLRFPRR